jgi:ribosome recycling factor
MHCIKYAQCDAPHRKMQAALEHLYHDMAGIRTGRVSTSILDAVPVEVYGEKQSLRHLATVVVRGPRTLSVSVYDVDNTAAVMEAIRQSPLGLEPRKEGVELLVPIPKCAPSQSLQFF